MSTAWSWLDMIYDDDNYYFNDPYENHGLIGYEKSLVEKRFEELGKQALIISEK